MIDSNVAIVWIDLTLEFKSILTQKKTIVLNKVSGCSMFGTLNAVMGPSGAGLTSLLKCLNGSNKSDLRDGTQFRFNKSREVITTFIGNNVKEFLIKGLTAKQNLIYASKLKNSLCNEYIDHQKNVSDIMSELLITDTMNTLAERCSGGEQKRLAIALELTAVRKPNLILCDEPTTGLDSNVAEVVMKSV